jgi:hypothetical protein
MPAVLPKKNNQDCLVLGYLPVEMHCMEPVEPATPHNVDKYGLLQQTTELGKKMMTSSAAVSEKVPYLEHI